MLQTLIEAGPGGSLQSAAGRMKPMSRWRMTFARLCWMGVAAFWLALSSQAATTNFTVRGTIKEIHRKEYQLVIAHDRIPDFMEAMTMPFNVKAGGISDNLAVGSAIDFQFHVSETDSWIDGIKITQSAPLQAQNPPTVSAAEVVDQSPASLRNFKFTNELGQPVSFSDFRGQAIALTFFFTRCPVPDFCPRLSRNFQETQRKMAALENGPTNWHLISVSFDPGRDTSEVLKAYADAYQYDPAHWTFLTGPGNEISQLAHQCGLEFQSEGGFFNHNFRTIIIDASNHLQMVFPTSGDLSDSIVQELVKAARPEGKLRNSTNTVNGVASKF